MPKKLSTGVENINRNIKKIESKEQVVARANMTFLPNPKDEPSIYEAQINGFNSWPRHPMDLFTILQDENPWVDLATRVIASSCASTLPIFQIEGDKKQKSKIDKYTKKLMSPNQKTTGYDMFYKIYSDLVLYGNSYIQVIKTKGGDLHSMYHIPAADVLVKIEFRADKNMYFVYEQIRPTIRKFEENEIIHIKTPNPKGFLYGKPLFYPNITNINIDENVSTWVRSFFEKGFSAGYIFKMDADQDVAERNREFLSEEYSKPENAGKTLLLEGDIDVVPQQKFGAGIDFSSVRSVSREDILQHAGVPLSMAGVRSDNGQANIQVIQAEQEAFLRNTVGHYHHIVFSALKQQLFETIFSETKLEINPGLLSQFANANALRLLESGSKIAMTINEFRRLANFEAIPDEHGGNTWIISTNNGVVKAEDIYGIDLNTGTAVKTLLEKSQDMQLQLATMKGAPPKGKAKTKGAGGTNSASSLSNPSGRDKTTSTVKKPKATS